MTDDDDTDYVKPVEGASVSVHNNGLSHSIRKFTERDVVEVLAVAGEAEFLAERLDVLERVDAGGQDEEDGRRRPRLLVRLGELHRRALCVFSAQLLLHKCPVGTQHAVLKLTNQAELFFFGKLTPSFQPHTYTEFGPNPHWTQARKLHTNPCKLLNTSIYNSQFHLPAFVSAHPV